MNRRELISALGLGAATFAMAEGTLRADDDDDDDHFSHASPDEKCEEQEHKHLMVLSRCAHLCNETAHHCLEEIRHGKDLDQGKLSTHARIHEMTMDCQAFCVLTATLMTRHSPLAGFAYHACAHACAECAKVCEEAGDHGELVKQCAEACRACEKMCRGMGGHHGEHRHHHHHHHEGGQEQPGRDQGGQQDPSSNR